VLYLIFGTLKISKNNRIKTAFEEIFYVSTLIGNQNSQLYFLRLLNSYELIGKQRALNGAVFQLFVLVVATINITIFYICHLHGRYFFMSGAKKKN